MARLRTFQCLCMSLTDSGEIVNPANPKDLYSNYQKIGQGYGAP